MWVSGSLARFYVGVLESVVHTGVVILLKCWHWPQGGLPDVGEIRLHLLQTLFRLQPSCRRVAWELPKPKRRELER